MVKSERETTALIGSDKVEGTTVYGVDGNRRQRTKPASSAAPCLGAP
jgi:hypothetical protein